MASRARTGNVVDSSARVRPSPLREDELYLGRGERTFVTHYRATGSAFTILAPPLFEEAARTRKVLVNLARDLAAAGDGEEGLAMAREGSYDVLVVDRVSRRLMLRAGSAVVGVSSMAVTWNSVKVSRSEVRISSRQVPAGVRLVFMWWFGV